MNKLDFNFYTQIATFLLLMIITLSFGHATAFAQTQFDCSSVTEIPIIECEALVAFYHSTDGDNWYDDNWGGTGTGEAAREGWIQTNTPCSWAGITCENNSVTEITKRWDRLRGNLPPEIGNLSNLTTLILRLNYLQSIPAEIGNLSNLTTLALEDNEIDTLPPEIGNLSNLESLSLSFNNLTTLPPEIGNLSDLRALGLNHNDLVSLPSELAMLPNLAVLTVTNNELTSIPPEILNMSSLDAFAYDENPITTPVQSDSPTHIALSKTNVNIKQQSIVWLTLISTLMLTTMLISRERNS